MSEYPRVSKQFLAGDPTQLEFRAGRFRSLVGDGGLGREVGPLLLVERQREVQRVVQKTALEADFVEPGGIECAAAGDVPRGDLCPLAPR